MTSLKVCVSVSVSVFEAMSETVCVLESVELEDGSSDRVFKLCTTVVNPVADRVVVFVPMSVGVRDEDGSSDRLIKLFTTVVRPEADSVEVFVSRSVTVCVSLLVIDSVATSVRVRDSLKVPVIVTTPVRLIV